MIIAFVQSMIETGWLGFAGSQIPPDAYNYAGINAFDGRASLPNCRTRDSAPSRCMGTPQHGVLMQIQLLRSYADPTTKTMLGRLISAPSDRVGAAPLWEYFGGTNCPCGKLIWASAPGYGLTSSGCTHKRSRRAGSPVRACRTARRTSAEHPAPATGR